MQGKKLMWNSKHRATNVTGTWKTLTNPCIYRVKDQSLKK
jgi:hypothetical protein